ncbi:MAG: universal stress protein, partial [Candidatus Korarchaeota archaeon]|nr:universal stress protein [Candidatus Korarchaeota archaeon]
MGSQRGADRISTPGGVLHSGGGVEALIEPARYTKALVALDLSPVSDSLIEWLPSLAPLGTSEVILVHVVDPAEYEHPVSGYDINALIEAAEREAARRLSGHAYRLRGVYRVSYIVRRGWPASVISEEAERLNADIIVAGSHGKGWFRSILLGSVSEELARTASRPVLIVKEILSYTEKGKRIAARPLVFEHVVAALDLSSPEACVLEHAAAIAASTGAEIHLVSIARRRTASLRARMEEHLEALRKIGVEASGLLLRGSPGKTIVEFAVHTDASLIILGPPEKESGIRGILRGRTLSVVLRHAPVSVLV